MSPIILHAGLLQMALYPDDGSLRYIMAGEHELLRGISAPIRDQTWATVRPKISELKVDQQESTFHVSFVAHCRTDEVDFRWKAQLTGSADGTLVFDFDGEALNGFLRNRIGFCVLHAAEVQGTPCVVTHTDGRVETGQFPTTITTGSPFSDIRSLTHTATPGLEVEVLMEGDTFEMEDQRNWTDASFKTFCTPLALPRPVLLEQGTKVHQRLTLRLKGQVPPPRAEFSPPWQAPKLARVSVGSQLNHKLPALGIIWNEITPHAAIIPALRSLRLSHLRVNLRLNDPSYVALLRSASRAATELNAALEIAVYSSDDAPSQFTRLHHHLDELAPTPSIARWLVYHEARDATPAETLAAARHEFDGSVHAAAMGGGGASDSFTELNYNSAIAKAADFTVHACNPQVHAFDEASIVETLPIQGLTAISAQRLSGGRPVVISPITFTRRWRLRESGASTGIPAHLQGYQSDPRHGNSFNAVWMLGSLSALSRAGVASATYFETVGDNGLFSATGTPRPIVDVFAAMSSLKGAPVIATESSHPLHVAALALTQGDRRMVLLANLRDGQQSVRITGAWGERSVKLAPYSIETVSLP